MGINSRTRVGLYAFLAAAALCLARGAAAQSAVEHLNSRTFSDLGLQLVTDLRWPPDGSGFLYTFPDLAYEFGNLFRYDFATKRVTQLTNYEGEYARRFDVSPDGAWIVYERAKKWDEDKGVELWLMRADGRDARLLVRDGLSPSWR